MPILLEPGEREAGVNGVIVCLEAAYHAFVVLGGFVALGFAAKRIWIAEQNLKQERFKTAGELLALRGHGYASRVAGAVVMAELARKDPKNYEKPVMRAFEAFLEHPPRYASVSVYKDREEESKMIDYESRDTVAIIDAIRERTCKQRRQYKTIMLSEHAPFVLYKDGKHIYCNSTNPSYEPWRDQHSGRCPSYECLAAKAGATVGQHSAWFAPHAPRAGPPQV